MLIILDNIKLELLNCYISADYLDTISFLIKMWESLIMSLMIHKTSIKLPTRFFKV